MPYAVRGIIDFMAKKGGAACMSVKQEKVQLVQEIKEKLSSSSSSVLIDYKGITVEEANELRKECREAGVDYKVYKNTLITIAARELGLEELEPHLVGPTAIAFGLEDPVAPAKVLSSNIDKLKKMEFKAGVLEGEVIDKETVEALAKLPSKEELIAKMIGSLNAPVYGVANVLSGTMRSLLYALNAIIEQGEQEA